MLSIDFTHFERADDGCICHYGGSITVKGELVNQVVIASGNDCNDNKFEEVIGGMLKEHFGLKSDYESGSLYYAIYGAQRDGIVIVELLSTNETENVFKITPGGYDCHTEAIYKMS